MNSQLSHPPIPLLSVRVLGLDCVASSIRILSGGLNVGFSTLSSRWGWWLARGWLRGGAFGVGRGVFREWERGIGGREGGLYVEPEQC